MHFHWQNLNEKPDGTNGSGIKNGRCWWHFGKNRTICFSWNLWCRFWMLEADIRDEDLTFHFGFAPVAFWLSFSTNFWPIRKLAPMAPLQYYPETIVIDERTIGVNCHDGTIHIKPWTRTMEWRSNDPWWARGISLDINPFRAVHQRHEVQCLDRARNSPPYFYWEPFVGSWEHDKSPDHRETYTYPYRYVLKSGEVQERTATVYVERMAWRPRCLQWTSLFEKVRTSIDVQFDQEVGERTGSWKGGTIGCSWELEPHETPRECLRRMEQKRVFA